MKQFNFNLKNKITLFFISIFVIIGLSLLLSKNIESYEDVDCSSMTNNGGCKVTIKTCKCLGYSYYSGFPGVGNKCIGVQMMCRSQKNENWVFIK